ncbi:MAG TPA: ribosome biogenesis GTPase Der [Gammaproteobacteria bacterium]|nr:ribosome biogenesis GTPase Der [Gammaproteobacteria bacterium]
MKPVIALVGRPNVGKSTLFNRLTKTRDALVADEPGLTRDRRYGHFYFDGQTYILIDTGGISRDEGIDGLITEQAYLAIEESSAVVFIVDGRAGLAPDDEAIAQKLRASGKAVFIAVNKTEGMNRDVVEAEFYALGIGSVYACSGAHGDGIAELFEAVTAAFSESEDLIAAEKLAKGARVAIVGRPNVGKSTLVNRLLGEERVLAFDMPGTTRDSIYIPFEHQGHEFTLIDTAGVRRKSRVNDKIEKFSIVKTLQAIESCNAVVLVLDARQGISSQDASLLGYVLDSGKALLIAVNKWDNLDKATKDLARKELDRKLAFVDFASIHFISALHGSGVGKLMAVVQRIYEVSRKTYATNMLTKILEDAVLSHAPPSVGGRKIKLRYAHQGGQNPPVFVVHGNQTEKLPESYRRYLINVFRKVLKIEGTPIKFEFKSGKNPFEGRKNKLTPNQMRKRKVQQLVKYRKKRDA